MLKMSSPHYNMSSGKSTLVFLALPLTFSVKKHLWTSIRARTSDLLPIIVMNETSVKKRDRHYFNKLG